PTGQDKGFMEKVLGPGTVYLSLAFQANSTLSDEGRKALQTFRDNMVTRQNDDGSWTTKINQAPVIDGHDVMTMLIMAVLSGSDSAKHRESAQRAMGWIKGQPVRDET